jgi:phage terminase large subunit-like protein
VLFTTKELERARPKKGQTLDLEKTIEAFLLELQRGYRIASVRYDPTQFVRSAATLQQAGLKMVEFPQTSGNLTEAGQTLWDLVRNRHLRLYRDDELRRHALNAVAIETPRGWRLAKDKSSMKIDGAAALSFACLDAVEQRPVTSPEFWACYDQLRAERLLSGEGAAIAVGIMERTF